MRCKPGDVAIINGGFLENLGKLVVVDHAHGDENYSHIGHGLLFCWQVESLGGKLRASGGLTYQGYIPDIALRPLGDITLSASAVARARAEADFKAAMSELAEILRDLERKGLLPEEANFETE